MANPVQDYIAFDERQVSILPEAVAPVPMSVSAQIGIENAARMRYMERTGKTVPYLPGGEANPHVLDTLCEACGEAQGKPYHAPYTQRTIHLCVTCAKVERAKAEQLNQMFGWQVCGYTLPVLPSEERR